jgi:hypothetical protein
VSDDWIRGAITKGLDDVQKAAVGRSCRIPSMPRDVGRRDGDPIT